MVVKALEFLSYNNIYNRYMWFYNTYAYSYLFC